ncbi:MAG TPA: hypothetical protein VF794_36665 [Archangium sp.]|jgi:hypothetical protein|uniref:hypothetical protein n=1 Tax=Archangium sp. TaxID=1872627 RepID=UPI002EDBB020
MALVTLRRLAWVLACGTLACGDSLVDERYSGTARFTVPGSVNGVSQYVTEANPEVSIGVFWSVRKPGATSETLIEQPGAALRAEYYRPFELKLFDEPGAEHFNTLPSGARYGAAWLAAYQDANDNGRRDETEPLIGGSNGRLLIRAPKALTAKDSPTGAALPEGWHLVSTPLNCSLPPGAPPPPAGSTPVPADPVADGECGVPLGNSCKNDAECGGGVCVREFLGGWPNGACLIPEPPPNGCRQKGSVLVRDPGNPTKGFWVKACTVSADCGRPAPFQCDQQRRMCKPSANVPVDLNDMGPPRGYCNPTGTTPPPP